MFDVQVTKTPQFNDDYEIMNDAQKRAADAAIALITGDPQAGESKKDYITGEHVYTFRHDNHLMLLSYQYDDTTRVLLSIEVREGFFKKR
jgi:hypothetical protein